MSHNLKGIYGVTYNCHNLEKKIYYNNLSTSLYTVKSLGFNNIRFEFNNNVDYSDFFSICCQLQLSVEIIIPNIIIETKNICQLQSFIKYIKFYPCIKIYTVGNQYNGDINNIIFILELLYSLDSTKFLMSSSIYDNDFKNVKSIYNKIPNYIKLSKKYIVGLNIFLPNLNSELYGKTLQNILHTYYLDPILKDSYLLITEFGNNQDNLQWSILWNFNIINIECLKMYPNYLGYELFEYFNSISNINKQNYGILTDEYNYKDAFFAIREFKNTNLYKKNIKTKLY